jgi:dienelactone hydrolase
LALPVLVAALALAACGGSGTTTSNSPSAAPSQAAVTVSPSPSWSPTMSPAPIPVVKPGQKPPPFAELKAMYAYDTSEPLDFKELPNLDDTVDGVKFRGIGFEQNGETVAGYLALPDGDGPFPVVVYAPGWKTAVMDVDDGWATEAAAMVKRGYAGLLLDEPITRFYTFDAPTDVAAFVLYATQERRAFDLLATLPEIDRGRIGFVGWSNGAILGSLLAGLEDRIKAYVFLGVCGMTTFSPEEKKSMNVPTGAAWARRYAAQMSVSDNVAYVGHTKGAKLLFINGKGDWDAMHDARAFLAAAPKSSAWHVYAGGHFPSGAAHNYWRAWILKNL